MAIMAIMATMAIMIAMAIMVDIAIMVAIMMAVTMAIMANTRNLMAITGHYDCHNGHNGHYFLTKVNVRSVRKVHTIHHPAVPLLRATVHLTLNLYQYTKYKVIRYEHWRLRQILG